MSTCTLFGTAIVEGGPPMVWAFLIAGCGQFLVALIFGEVVAQYPIAGGVYPWARRLWGKRWAWMTGWVYMWALLVTITSVAYGAGPYIAILFGFDATVLCTAVLIVVAILINYMGTKALSAAAIIGFGGELIGAPVVGIYLLATHRHHGLGVVFDTYGIEQNGSYLPAFLAAAIIGPYQYYGFEACGGSRSSSPSPHCSPRTPSPTSSRWPSSASTARSRWSSWPRSAPGSRAGARQVSSPWGGGVSR
ncbi:APC family permease [Streptomyces sp. bgisy034]|uniref:APC family permease n=1 Tax=Streptomyces sp. bgisy034 TaxID=3413774 RepID=UPI003EC106E0